MYKRIPPRAVMHEKINIFLCSFSLRTYETSQQNQKISEDEDENSYQKRFHFSYDDHQMA
jgi:hypothetical protein